VSPDYGPHDNEFNGVVRGVQLAVDEAADSAEHRVSPEEAMRVAMARQ
jgi:arylsulfatase